MMTETKDSDAKAAAVEMGAPREDDVAETTEGTVPMVAILDLRYAVRKPDKSTLTILDGVTSAFEAGEMTAVMGTSGAGKTTLLDLLAGRRSTKTAAEYSGSLLFAGAAPNDVVRKRYTGYCEQFDTLVPVLTVRETLDCTAELKCSNKVPTTLKRERVDEILGELGLKHVADSLVGNPAAGNKSISGGQRKRLNIGVALITKPAVLMLDEPTTGLDSATADDILALTASLARQGGRRAVVATLHSPSSRAFRLSVDKLLCLGTGGKVLYSGDPNVGPLVDHLDASGAPPYARGDSLADHVMAVFGGGVEASPRERAEKYGAAWAASAPGIAERARLMAVAREHREPSTIASLHREADSAAEILGKAAAGSLAWHPDDPRRHLAVATSVPKGVATLLWYRARRNFVDGEYIGARLGDKVLYGLILATLYWSEGSKQRSEQNVNNTAGLLWFIVILPGYAAAAYVPQLVLERPVLLREYADGCYASSTYLFAKIVEEFVCILPFSLMFCAGLFYSIQLQGSFWILFLVNYLMFCSGVAVAYFVSAASPNVEAANAILPTYVTCNIIFAGFLIIRSDIPDAWRWYTWCNPFSYAWIAVMKNNFRSSNGEDFAEANDVLDHYDLHRMPGIWPNIGFLAVFVAGYILLAAVAVHNQVQTK